MTNAIVIFLNGTSSAGKTTLAQALQERLPAPFQHIALDQFRDGMPAKYRGLNAPEGTTGSEGLNVVPVTRESGDKVTEVRFGDAGQLLLRGMRRAIATLVNEGNNVIVDDIILNDSFLQDYLIALSSCDVYFVGVRCPLEVIAEREAVRLGRFPGTAESHYDACHSHGRYDVEVDTSIESPAECARKVIDRIDAGPPAAFQELRAIPR